MTALELLDVTKNYGRVRAVDGVSLAVPDGALFGLIGPNGAGKTTTFGLLSGFLSPTSGEVRVRGRVLSPAHPPVGRVLALPQDAHLPARKRVLSLLIFLGRLSGMSRRQARESGEHALERVGLADLAARPVGTLSHGQRRRVGLAQCLVGNDEVIVLDEPTSGLDPRTALELGQLIRDLHRDRTIVLSSHNLGEVEALCTHAAILDRGRLVAAGTMDRIKGTGERLFVRLGGRTPPPDALRSELLALDGVVGAEVTEGGGQLSLRAGCGADVDRVTADVLKLLLDRGVAVQGVERGQRLEDRFMAETSGSDAR